MFAEAARRTAQLAGGPPTPGAVKKFSHALGSLKLPETTGWECRAVRLRGAILKDTLAKMQADAFGTMSMGSSAYAKVIDWARNPGAPLWSDSGDKASKEVLIQKGRRAISHEKVVRAMGHNGMQVQERHEIGVYNGEKDLRCKSCGMWVPG